MKQTVKIKGNVGGTPILRHTTQGVPVLNFSLAKDTKTRDLQGEASKLVSWYQVVVFGPRAASLQQKIQKGQFLEVHGTLRRQSFAGCGGQNRKVYKLNAGQINFLGRREEAEPAANTTAAYDAELCPPA